jgi:hypothetical protein
MRKYALIKDNVVVSVETFGEDTYQEKAKEYQLIVDIEDMAVEPQVGWVLEGNQLKPFSENLSPEQREDIRMRARFKVGNRVCDEAVVMISRRNKILGKTATEVNQIITTFMPIEQAMRKCALPTALGGINKMRALYPEYEDIFDYVVAELSNYLNSEV